MGAEFSICEGFASLQTSLVMCMKCSLKSSSGLMCTPSIFFDLFGGRYVICDPSR